MNIEEKLQTLTNGLQALVEMHAQNEQRMQSLIEAQAQNEQRMAKMIQAMDRMNRRNQTLESLVTNIAEGTARLMRAVDAHDHRISALEERQS